MLEECRYLFQQMSHLIHMVARVPIITRDPNVNKLLPNVAGTIIHGCSEAPNIWWVLHLVTLKDRVKVKVHGDTEEFSVDTDKQAAAGVAF